MFRAKSTRVHFLSKEHRIPLVKSRLFSVSSRRKTHVRQQKLTKGAQLYLCTL